MEQHSLFSVTQRIHHFEPAQRGSVNSTVSFIRSLGMTLGITIFGIIQRDEFSSKLKEIFAGQDQMVNNPTFNDPRVILAPEARAHIPAPVLDKIVGVLSSSIAHTFMWALIPTVLAFVAANNEQRTIENISRK